VWLLWKHSEYSQLVELSVNPMQYNNAASFRDDYAATMLLSKADFIPLEVSKKDAAIKKFFRFEDQCRVTNRSLINLGANPKYTGSNVWMLNATIQKIAKILGGFSPEELVDSCNWGPGSSTLLKGAHVSGANKFEADNGITSDLYSLVGGWFSTAYPLWDKHLTERSESRFTIQAGNKIVTVPKNSKTDRVIAIEPGINLWFQKGIGSMIRRRLQRWGVDLNDQTRNQELSKQASLHVEWSDASLATIDFSSASDSISRETVNLLISGDWLSILTATRSPFGTLDNKPVRWQKFSSMGNGYTFELESLIFYAAALSARELVGCDGEVSVYGDDVILPTQCVSTFHQFCDFLGFTINDEKSFFSSQFRESCGSHYFNGTDVKPFYLKSRLSTLSSVFKLANSVRLFAHRCNSHRSCDARFRACYSGFIRRVPKNLRFFVPAGYGDGGFASNFDEATPARAKHGIEGFRVRHVQETGVHYTTETTGLLLSRLKAISGAGEAHLSGTVRPTYYNRARSFGNPLPAELESDALWSDGGYMLRSKTRTRIAVMVVHQWYNLGPWD
jgi:hypothetical protein